MTLTKPLSGLSRARRSSRPVPAKHPKRPKSPNRATQQDLDGGAIVDSKSSPPGRPVADPTIGHVADGRFDAGQRRRFFLERAFRAQPRHAALLCFCFCDAREPQRSSSSMLSR